MDKCVDMYSRLIIATITFVVPIIINLLSTFTAGEKRRKELSLETEESINILAAQEIQEKPERIKETISTKHKEYEKNEKSTKAELDLLNPLIQFWYIFSCLSVCFLSLILYYLISNQSNMYNCYKSIIILLVSIVSYCASLYFIIRILYTISRTRKIIEDN